MPLCIRKYVHASVNPFHPEAAGACIPMGDGGRTYKYSSTARVTINVSSVTDGIVLTWSPTPVNDSNELSWGYSNGVNSFDSTTVVAQFPPNGSLLTTASLGLGTFEHRLVGAEIRVVNTGPALYQKGRAIAYYTPSGGSLHGSSSPATYTSRFNVRAMNMSDMKTRNPLRLIHYHDRTTELTQWYTTQHVDGITGTYASGLTRGPGFMFIPADTQGNVGIFVETICHWEVRGSVVTRAGSTEDPQPTLFMKAAGYASDFLASAGTYLPAPEVMAGRVLATLWASSRNQRPTLTW